MSFQEFHRTIGTLTSLIDLKIILQPFISSEMVKTLSWPRAAYPEFALSVGYNDGFLHQKRGELELCVSSVKMRLSHKLKPDGSGISVSLKCSDIKSNNLSHWNMSRIISMTRFFFLK